ncbi:MAG: hypothetical protein ACTS5Y_07780, partial [Pollutimonas bauzanensis]
GWVEWIVLDQEQAQPQVEAPYAERYSSRKNGQDELGTRAADLDARVKTLFDPAEVFPYPGQDV